MTAPIDTAYAALCAKLAEDLVTAGFLARPEALEVDPAGACAPGGDETAVQTSAQIFSLSIDPVRQLMGGAVSRWVVDAQYRLELAAFGPSAEGEETYKQRLAAAMTAVALVVADDPTLGQTCERLIASSSEDDDLPPNGMKVAVPLTIRLRAGDPYGRTAP